MILRRVAELRLAVAEWKRQGAAVGLVPTMGALHAGHVSLVRAARAGADRVIVTIFVNPAQFDNKADLARYPRSEERDAALLAPLGVDALFAPLADEVYPPGFATTVTVGGVAQAMDGERRPGHFAGVATVVAKLFGITGADRAWFGEKDWQQLLVVRRLVADLNLAVEVIGHPTLRDADGLAMSSRNARLSAEARAVAAALPREMAAAAASLLSGEGAEAVSGRAKAALAAAGFGPVEYLDLRRGDDLTPLDAAVPGARLFAAAWIGGVRLIDNIPVGPNLP